MNCFERIIGIDNPCEPLILGTSGLFVSNALDFAWAKADRIAASEHNTNEYILNVLKKSYVKVDGDISLALNSNGFNLNNTTTESYYTGVNLAGTVTPLNTNKYVGLVFNQKTYSPLNNIFVTELRIYLTAPITTLNLQISDAGIIKTYTLNHNFIAGENIIDVTQTFGNYIKLQAKPNQKAKILIDNNLPLANIQNCCNCAGQAINGRPRCGCVNIGSWDGVREGGSQGFGLVATIYCGCSLDMLICEWANKNKSFGHVVLAAFNYMWLREQLLNPSINYISVGKPSSEAIAKAEKDYINKYNAFILSSSDLIKKTDPKCLTCTGVKYYSS